MQNTKPQLLKRKTVFLAAAFVAWLWCVRGVVWADLNGAPIDAAPIGVLPNAPIKEAGAEHFLQHTSRIECEGTIQMLRSVELSGNEIRVRNIARWSDSDSVGFSSIADLVIDHFDDSSSRRLSLDELRSTLSGAGVNLSRVHFSGTSSCLISRNQTPAPLKDSTDPRESVRQWIEKNKQAIAENPPIQKLTTDAPTDAGHDSADPQFHSLRDTIVLDLAQRLNLSIDDVLMTFDPKDRNYLSLIEPSFHFQLEPRRLTDLGKVSWDVTISSAKSSQKITVNAEARVWEKQLVTAKSISYHQVLREDDFTDRRVLVDHLEYDPLLTRAQTVGQQAARDLKPGMLLTARTLEPVPLVKQGEIVSITLNSGGICIHTVATAMESGSYGQSIKVKDEASQNIFVVTMTGPQAGTMGSTVTPSSGNSAVAQLER